MRIAAGAAEPSIVPPEPGATFYGWLCGFWGGLEVRP